MKKFYYTRLSNLQMNKPTTDRTYIILLGLIFTNPGRTIKWYAQTNPRVTLSNTYDYLNHFSNRGLIEYKNSEQGRKCYITLLGKNLLSKALV